MKTKLTSHLFVLISTITFCSTLLAHSPASGAIFGVDDRVSITPSMQSNAQARSTAVAVLSALYKYEADGTVTIEPDSMNEYICQDIKNPKMAKGPSMAYACSGFLVGPDLLVTAGHCGVNTGEVRNETEYYCDVYSWLFDYQESLSGSVRIKGISKDNLYHCKRIVYAVMESQFPFRDYALIQLDRPVKGRKPLKLSEKVETGDKGITMIGHPMGRPSTLSRNAKVLVNDPSLQAFITNLDAFEGNSGSAVFNNKKEVIGLLIGGTPMSSTIDDEKNNCRRFNVCDEEGNNCLLPDGDTSKMPGLQRTGSEVQRITPIIDLLKQTNL